MEGWRYAYRPARKVPRNSRLLRDSEASLHLETSMELQFRPQRSLEGASADPPRVPSEVPREVPTPAHTDEPRDAIEIIFAF